jgi:hypothetical protein
MRKEVSAEGGKTSRMEEAHHFYRKPLFQTRILLLRKEYIEGSRNLELFT